MHLTALTDSSNLPKTGVTVQARAKHRDASSRPLLSPSTTIKWKIVRWRRQSLLMKNWFSVTFYPSCSSSLPVSPSSFHLLPSPSSIPLFYSPSISVAFINLPLETFRGEFISSDGSQSIDFTVSIRYRPLPQTVKVVPIIYL